MKIFFVSAFLSLPVMLQAQTMSGDSILANERSIDRPITLHGGQIRVTGGYGLSMISRRFGDDGEVIKLKDEGLATVRHRFSLDLKYGLHDLIQFNAAIAHASNTVREPSRYIYPMEPEPIVSQDVVKEYTGMEDLYVGLDFRAPLKTRKLDIAVTLGALLPLASSEPAQPKHSFTAQPDDGVHRFVYRYKYPSGKGIAVGTMGATAKYRTRQWALSGRIEYQHGLTDGKNFEWRHQLNEYGEFQYRQDPFLYRLPDAFSYFGELEYQASRRVDLFINVSGRTAFNGWVSPQDDVKVAIPYQTILVASPGVELIVMPRLWLRERLNFSLGGKSYEAPFGIETTLLYNIFPFH